MQISGIPAEYCALLDRFTAESREILGEALTGVYLHGSAVMGCFNPQVSDLDLLTVVSAPLTDETKRRYMDMVLRLDAEAPAKGIEMSILPASACRPFAYPTPFLLHYSRMHTAWYRRDPGDYIAKMQGTDPDLAAHCTILYHRGICLWGAAIREVFDPVPKACYLDSIRDDIAEAEADISENPVYITLNLCRVLAYVREGVILSKEEGGQWALRALPERYHALVTEALRAYGNEGGMDFDPALAREFAGWMLREIERGDAS